MFYSVTYICKSNKQKDTKIHKKITFIYYLPKYLAKYVFRH